jgi:transcriptional regulator with XRE-family HTH domain
MSTQPEVGQVPEFTIAERLQLARTIAKLEKQELADRIGVSRDTIANYESRAWPRRRSPAYLKSWALACGVSYAWLETGQDPRDGGPDDGLPHLDSNQKPFDYRLAA